MLKKQKKEPKLVSRCRVARLTSHSLFAETHVTAKGRVLRTVKKENNKP